MNVTIATITQSMIPGVSTDQLIAHIARVSNPDNQMNHETGPNLLNYLTRKKHWSPFQMVNMGVKIETTRAIAAQILRHRSASFQEFSQRYAEVDPTNLVLPEMRLKADKNRQSSSEVTHDFDDQVDEHIQHSFKFYGELVEHGVATESARMLLPLCAPTTLYMNNDIRSWIHYLEQRCDEHTQKEHRLLAYQIKELIGKYYPTTYEALFNED